MNSKLQFPDVSSRNWNMTQNFYKIKFQLTRFVYIWYKTENFQKFSKIIYILTTSVNFTRFSDLVTIYEVLMRTYLGQGDKKWT